MSKKKDTTAVQWAKTLRDLLELRNATMDKIKAHLLGRDETGVVREPEDVWDRWPQVAFERYFKDKVLSPWTLDDLKLKCRDCGFESEDVYVRDAVDLCDKCYAKREEAAKIPECMVCHVKDGTVKKHATQGNWFGGTLVGVHEYTLCARCWVDMKQGKPPNPEPPHGP
jgi:hypothetical protein